MEAALATATPHKQKAFAPMLESWLKPASIKCCCDPGKRNYQLTFSRIGAHCKQHDLVIRGCFIGFYGLQIHVANRLKADIHSALRQYVDDETEFVLFPLNCMGVVFAAIGGMMLSLWMDKKVPAAATPAAEAAVVQQPGRAPSAI
jgi:hypothetical protein